MSKCFVFGSNLGGRHGAGAARTAYKSHAAREGVGFGYSRVHIVYRDMTSKEISSFAIPTKDEDIKTLPLNRVKGYVQAFLAFAAASPHIEFQVTKIGCGLAGYKDEEIAPMFEHAPSNCSFDEGWAPYLPNAKFWGKY